jgi:hypothetical protein
LQFLKKKWQGLFSHFFRLFYILSRSRSAILSGIGELLFHPDSFFYRKMQEETNLLIPAIIVGIGSMVNLVTPFIVSAFRLDRDPTQVIMFPDAIVFYLIFPFIAGFLITGILYVLCHMFHGNGSFTATLQNCGYGCLPLTFLSLCGTVGSVMSEYFFRNLSMTPSVITYGLGFVSVLFVIWSGWIWTTAMEKPMYSHAAKQRLQQ